MEPTTTETKTSTEPKLSAVPNIADARKAKAKKARKTDTAPLEAFAPEATPLQGDDFEIRGCDGEQVYLWIATKRKGAKSFKITELHPGLTKKQTRIRDAETAEDLVLVGRYPTAGDVMEELHSIMFEDLIEDVGDEAGEGDEQN